MHLSNDTNGSYSIRPYHPTDQAACLELLRQNTPSHFAPEEAPDFLHYLAHEREAYYVVCANKVIIACGGINYFEREQLARLSWDIVAPNWQGKGVGRLLVSHRVEAMRKHPNTEQAVVRTSQLAYRFYEKMGFRLEKTQEHYWAPNLHLHQMSMDLTSF